jgi:hypothetical protein
MVVSPPGNVCKPFDASPTSGVDRAAALTSRLDLLKGLEVHMPSSCSKCGCVTALIHAEANRSSLRCTSCRAHLGSVSSLTERFLEKIVECFGRPTKPIQVRQNPLTELSPAPSGAGTTTTSLITAPEKRNRNVK